MEKDDFLFYSGIGLFVLGIIGFIISQHFKVGINNSSFVLIMFILIPILWFLFEIIYFIRVKASDIYIKDFKEFLCHNFLLLLVSLLMSFGIVGAISIIYFLTLFSIIGIIFGIIISVIGIILGIKYLAYYIIIKRRSKK